MQGVFLQLWVQRYLTISKFAKKNPLYTVIHINFPEKWPSIGPLDSHLAKSLLLPLLSRHQEFDTVT